MKPSSSSEAPSREKAGPTIVGLVSLVVLSLLFLASVFYSLPSNVVDRRDGSTARTGVAQLLPNSWGFFTKPPNSSELAAFTVDDGKVNYALDFPHSRPQNLFGLTRAHRAQGPELARLTNGLKESAWIDCSETDGDCIVAASNDTPPEKVTNDIDVPSLCGDVIIVEREPVPWSYRNDFDGWRLEKQSVHLDVKCNS